MKPFWSVWLRTANKEQLKMITMEYFTRRLAALLFIGLSLVLNNVCTIKHAINVDHDFRSAVIGLAALSIISFAIVVVLVTYATKYETDYHLDDPWLGNKQLNGNIKKISAEKVNIENGHLDAKSDDVHSQDEEEVKQSLTENPETSSEPTTNDQEELGMVGETIGTQTTGRKHVGKRLYIVYNIIVVILFACFLFNILYVSLDMHNFQPHSEVTEHSMSLKTTTTEAMNSTLFTENATTSSILSTTSN